MAASKTDEIEIGRRGFLGGLVAVGATFATPAICRAAGDFRSVRLFNKRTGDWINTVYWVDGQYVSEALHAISHLMRDWRQNEVAPISPATIDIIAATWRKLETSEPFEVISGYRTPETNALLRSRGRGVARKSYHVKAMAADLKLEGRSVAQIARAAKSLRAGGVGMYTRAKFVHVDSGPLRDWGR